MPASRVSVRSRFPPIGRIHTSLFAVPTLDEVARYYDVHPQNPQRRTIGQVVGLLREGGLIVYPTDSGFALGCRIDAREAVERIRTLRRLDDRHHFTLVCRDFAQLGQFVEVSNPVFRAVKAATPGPFTFILPASREVPRRLSHPRKRTVGVRIPDNAVVRDLLDELGEPLLSSTLLLVVAETKLRLPLPPAPSAKKIVPFEVFP